MTEVETGDGPTARRAGAREDPLHRRLRWVLEQRAGQLSDELGEELTWDSPQVKEQLATEIGMSSRRLRDWLGGDYPRRGRRSAHLEGLERLSRQLPGYPPRDDPRSAAEIARSAGIARPERGLGDGRARCVSTGTADGPGAGVATRMRAVVAVLTIGVVIVATVVVLWSQRGDSHPGLRVQVQAPTDGARVGATTPLHGTISAALAAGHTLWAVQRSEDESNLHPLDHGCPVAQRAWACDDVYVGRDTDVGRRFVISVVDADPDATAFFERYGSRDKNVADTYVGIEALPHGAQTLATVTVVRR